MDCVVRMCGAYVCALVCAHVCMCVYVCVHACVCVCVSLRVHVCACSVALCFLPMLSTFVRSFSYFSSSSADSSGLKTDLHQGAMSSVPALHQAALDDDESACQALLIDGADRDSVDHAGCTAFNLSCYKGGVSVFRLLVSGASTTELNRPLDNSFPPHYFMSDWVGSSRRL